MINFELFQKVDFRIRLLVVFDSTLTKLDSWVTGSKRSASSSHPSQLQNFTKLDRCGSAWQSFKIDSRLSAVLVSPLSLVYFDFLRKFDWVESTASGSFASNSYCLFVLHRSKPYHLKSELSIWMLVFR